MKVLTLLSLLTFHCMVDVTMGQDTILVMQQPADNTQNVQTVQTVEAVLVQQGPDNTQTMQTVQIVQPADNTQTVQLVQPADNTQTVQTVQVVQPADNTQTVQLVQNADNTQTVQLVQPADNTQTVQTVQVVQPADNTQTVTVQQPAQQTQNQNSILSNYQLSGTFLLQQAQQTVVDPVYVLPENASELRQNATESPPNYEYDDGDYNDDGLPPLTLLFPQSGPITYPANGFSPLIFQQIPQLATLTPEQIQLLAQQFPGVVPAQESPMTATPRPTTTTTTPTTTTTTTPRPTTTTTTTQEPSTTTQEAAPKVPSTIQHPLTRIPAYIYAPNYQQFYRPALPQQYPQIPYQISPQVSPQFNIIRMVPPQPLVFVRPVVPGTNQQFYQQRAPCPTFMQPFAGLNQYQRQRTPPSH